MTTALPDGTWTLDPDQTNVTVDVKNFVVKTVSATLALTDGTITVADGEVSAVSANLDATSYKSPNAKRNEHVINPDFLDSQTHPTINFNATEASTKARGYELSGTVTVKGKATPVTVTVSDLAIDGENATFTAGASIDRNEIGVDKMPSLMIGNTLQIAIDATARLH